MSMATCTVQRSLPMCVKKQHVFVFCSFLSFFPIHHGWVTRTKTERLITRPRFYDLGFPILLRNCQDKAWISFWDPKFEGQGLTPNEDRTGTEIEQWTFRRTPKLPGCDRDYEVTDRKERWYKQSKYYVLIQKDGPSVPRNDSEKARKFSTLFLKDKSWVNLVDATDQAGSHRG